MSKNTRNSQLLSTKAPKTMPIPKHLEHINVWSAGIDIGAESHFVAVPDGCDEKTVREFKTFTTGLNELADWLKQCGIKTVAMESTGVYWIPVYELLEEKGFAVKLVDARQVKNVSGRKTDVLDCQWLQQLHTDPLSEIVQDRRRPRLGPVLPARREEARCSPGGRPLRPA